MKSWTICAALLCSAGLWACGEQYVQRPATTPVEGRESPPQSNPKGQQAPERAETAARVFLRGYLPYSYGRGSVEDFGPEIITPDLRQRFREQPPRPHSEARRAQPRVVAMRLARVRSDEVLLYADIEDGIAPYTLLLRLVRHLEGWAMAAVGLTG